MEEQEIIKHLVICGGGIYGLSYYGALNFLGRKGYLDFSKLKTIHATSAGSVITVMILLEPDWDITENYMINRPWKEILQLNVKDVLNISKSAGIYNVENVIKFLLPFFKLHDLDIHTITVLDFYKYTKKDIYIYTTNVNKFELECIHWSTHPTWRLIDALFASCSVPIIFQPHYSNISKCYYADGGLFMNYPIEPCMEICTKEKDSFDSILGINQDKEEATLEKRDYSLLEYMNILTSKILFKTNEKKLDIEQKQPKEINIGKTKSSFVFSSIIKNKKERIELINIGKKFAENFYENIHQSLDTTDDIPSSVDNSKESS